MNSYNFPNLTSKDTSHAINDCCRNNARSLKLIKSVKALSARKVPEIPAGINFHSFHRSMFKFHSKLNRELNQEDVGQSPL